MSRIRNGLVVLLAGALCVTACGRSTSDDNPAAGAAIGTGAATGTITMWAQGAEAEKLPTLLKTFEAQNPGVHVNVTPIPWDAAHNKYQTAIAGGTTPDIGQLGTTWMGEFGAANALAPVPADLNAAAFYPGAVKSTQVGDGTYAIPWYVDTPVLYYRTDLAAKAGFAGPPVTWDQFKALAKALQAKAGAKFGVSLGAKDFQGFLPFAWSNGANLTSADGKSWTLDDPAMIDAVRYFQSFFTEGIADKSPSNDPGAHEAAFVNGSVPMFIGGPFEVSELAKAGGKDFTAKYATAVVPKQKTATSFVGGSNLVVFKKSANSDAAWKLIRFLADPATQVAWYKTTGDLPSAQAAWTDPTLAGDPKLAVFGQQLKDVNAPPATAEWTEVQKAGDTQMEKVNVSGEDPAAAMKSLQATAASIGTGA
ncbi:sugar ABC transporter substrate-binding protein [Actinoplanes sp. KI2]|uniref:sugar ABC transporter substrate-binding protein n=1 Tax=Actinoplanes sp. KI2 TaxID=2983315 RepID=UPI0021D577DA|nr:sugar ABC transporter substrate-binding protein [Actinoplanes sp. KI2]MCU7724277.1 sugar ABC transporter substrate-binding protein [Actinoplanes sp. KI2]